MRNLKLQVQAKRAQKTDKTYLGSIGWWTTDQHL